jgi:(Z)-2-((N-methylformamido)methylene)-5-hydroxybutyrolactone dehydrogenase
MAAPYQAAGALPRFLLRIGGQAVEPASGEYFQSENPYTAEPWCEVARGTAADVNKAVAAAKIAKKQWAETLPGERGLRLLRLADIVENNVVRLAELDCRDNGKTIAELTHATRAIVDWLRYFAGLTDKLQGDVLPQERHGYFNYTHHEPLGIIGVVTPWNSPITLMTMKVAPALAAGNAVIVKPSEFTSAATIEYADLFVEAGFPEGLVNVVTGFGGEAGAALVNHPEIAKIAFTGSEPGGQRIYEGAAAGLKQVLLELGGKSANIVFADANLEAAAMGALGGIFTAAGQTCIAGSRLLVQRSIHDELVGRMLDVLKTARLGDPMDPATNMGPIANPPQYEKVLKYIDVAKEEGAVCVAGGRPSNVGKYFVEPTIFTGVNNRMRIAQEEVFGPVLSVIPFEDDEEAYAIANDTPFGLAAGVWTSDIKRAMTAPRRLQVGHVWINTYRIGGHTMPFGGVKRSGIGREGGVDALKEFTSVKTVVMGLDPSLINPFAMR